MSGDRTAGKGKGNPLTLDEVRRMSAAEFRVFSFLMLQRLDCRTRRIEDRLWWVTGVVLLSVLLTILRLAV